MLQNPIHLRLERLESWQHVTFMACLCERMYPNYAMFCQQTGFGDGQIYRRILDLIWETLTVKDAKVNFDSQLEKFEEAIPSADDFDLYGVYPAIDACVALSELVHSRLSGETLEHAVEVSKTSITTVAMLEMTQAGREMTDAGVRRDARGLCRFRAHLSAKRAQHCHFSERLFDQYDCSARLHARTRHGRSRAHGKHRGSH